ncbi:MAG TPA: SbcC/MukB-like Walker B domain-containing protein [Propionicimonas sp.]|jgi:uncharacterized protein YPO0396
MTLFGAADIQPAEGLVYRGQWRLSRIEVVNWGTFDGFHGVDVARRGHLVTGASGSGKSSILDAIAAVLTPKGAITFNAAAQESVGRASDRTWITYVRGAWSKEADELEDRTVAAYLRTGATWSGILLRFENGRDDPVSLIRLFHLRGTSSDAADLKELNFITRTSDGLMVFAPYASGGIDVRRLDAEHHPVVATTTGKHAGYFQRLQRLLGIEKDTALQLLHKTQAAKNLGTLDTLFRRFMLDEPATFRRADAAVDQFAELRDAYHHVVDLRRQRDALLEVASAADGFEHAHDAAQQLAVVVEAVSPFARSLHLALSREALVDATAEAAKAAGRLGRAQALLDDAEERHSAALARVGELGGGDLAAHRARIGDAERVRHDVEQRRDRLAGRLAAVGIPMASSESEYSDLVAVAHESLTEPLPAALDHELLDRLSGARRAVDDLKTSLQLLDLHKSKIEKGLLRVREELCRDLDIPVGLLPFAGELISVREEFAHWTGAIERVLAPMSTALLVRDEELAAVRQAVDRRHLGVNLTIDAVPAASAAPLAVGDSRSLVYRVDVAPGIFAGYLNRRLSEEFDHACVDAPGELDAVSRGVTLNGLVKRSGRRYAKADKYDVRDTARWVLGGDLGPKRDELERRLKVARDQFEDLDSQANVASAARDTALERRQLLKELIASPWSDIDVEGAASRVTFLEQTLRQLVAPDSELGHASAVETEAREARDRLRTAANEAGQKRALADAAREQLQTAVDELGRESVPVVAEEASRVLDERFRAQQRVIRFDQVDAVAMRVQGQLHMELDRAQKQVQDAIGVYAERAAGYKRDWPEPALDLTAQIEDRGGYRAILDGIRSRGLPEHEANFRRLLDSRSRESVTFLRDELLGVLRQIQHRIAPVNDSLSRSQFDRGRYLNIRVKLRRTQEVTEFLDQLKAIVDGNWADEDLAAAERRFAVLATIMRRLGSSDRVDREWRGRVLDTREHVSFIAEEVDESGKVHNVHDSSAGLSGGQRQKLVVFCLAAALRYQLAEPDAPFPQYGTVVLDEAFDKADTEYTRMAMDIFVAFGFQMILATPGKLLQTLEPYIGAVTVVTNPERKASRLANVEY